LKALEIDIDIPLICWRYEQNGIKAGAGLNTSRRVSTK
jgi:hypothetical protein